MPMFGQKTPQPRRTGMGSTNPNDVVADVVFRPVNHPKQGAGSRASVSVVEFRHGGYGLLDATLANPQTWQPGDQYELYHRYERVEGDHGLVSDPPAK